MSDPAPGRYCLAVCYCGQCAHYVPIPEPQWPTTKELTWHQKRAKKMAEEGLA